jgi:hypothetical protein
MDPELRPREYLRLLNRYDYGWTTWHSNGTYPCHPGAVGFLDHVGRFRKEISIPDVILENARMHHFGALASEDGAYTITQAGMQFNPE